MLCVPQMSQASLSLGTNELIVVPVTCHWIVSDHMLAQDLRLLFQASSCYFWESSDSGTVCAEEQIWLWSALPALVSEVSKLLSKVLLFGAPKPAKPPRCLNPNSHKTSQKQSPLQFCLPPLFARWPDLLSEPTLNIRPCYWMRADFATPKYISLA